MRVEEEDIELIERYLNSELSPEELDAFKQRLEVDSAFAEKVDDYKAIITGVRHLGHKKFTEELAAWEHEIKNEETAVQTIDLRARRWKKYLAVAAAVVLLILSLLYFMVPRAPVNTEDLFTAYFVPYDDVVSVRDGRENDETLGYALQNYGDGKYKEAIPYFQSYLSTDSQNHDAMFYLGTSALAEKNTAVAVPPLRELVAQRSIYAEQAAWYLALAALLENNKESARTQLKDIAENKSHSMHEKAEELLGRLD